MDIADKKDVIDIISKDKDITDADNKILTENDTGNSYTNTVKTNEILKKTDIYSSDVSKKPMGTGKPSCFQCHKKLSLAESISGKCSCSLLFCQSHRLPSEHSCGFDFKTEGLARLNKENPKVVNPKITKL